MVTDTDAGVWRIETEVRAARARMKRTAILEMAVRWSLYASLIASGYLAASKLFSWPRAVLWAAAAVPAAAAIREAARRVDLRRAAATLDRMLGLEERVATALECASAGGLSEAVVRDASEALGRARPAAVGRFRWPGEARFLAPALALFGALWMAPDRRQAPATADAGLRGAMTREWAALAPAVRRLEDPKWAEKARKILEDLGSTDMGRIREAAVGARELAVAIRKEQGELTGANAAGGESLRALADLLDAAGASATRELARRGVTVPDVAPDDLEARALAAQARGDLGGPSGRPRQFEAPAAPGGPVVAPTPGEATGTARDKKTWDPEYDDVVRRYYELRSR
ncbi:MAG: hypothetical protein HY716_02520 [Planctomycetes bacterium]|nr:hypothetical protein [Planctomycetota bacterium]